MELDTWLELDGTLELTAWLELLETAELCEEDVVWLEEDDCTACEDDAGAEAL